MYLAREPALTQPSSGPPRVLDLFGDDTRGRILRGTAEVVARRGVEGRTVQDLLDAAGVSRRTFYKHFRSLDDALDALYEGAIRVLSATLELALAAEADPVARLVRAVDAWLDLQLVGGRLVRVLQAEALRPGSPLAERRERLLGRLEGLLDDMVQRLHGRRLDPLVYRAALVTMEGLVNDVHRRGRLGEAQRDRLRAVLVPLLARALDLPEGAARALPTRPEKGVDAAGARE